ncbi:dihydropteroate synthase [Rhabdaerophilum sp. SD176]|uniref:dihydropteroate synthase n=1 Tax=Rhabdaerophilum sp. SD176 TaxID=2983548 RepID=UPI0024E01A83|nr:dihydropteroate synthase [Rhabdaerophilum sp. SD176]
MIDPPLTTAAPVRLAAPWPALPETGPLLMGIVNVTPDSFSDGGQFETHAAAIAQARRLAAEGADILDIGGESTRPGAAGVGLEEEISRVVPVIRALAADTGLPVISIDSYKAGTTREALAAGARIANDVWGLQREPALADVAQAAGAGLCLMHNRDMKDPAIDIVEDMKTFFARSLAIASRAGIPGERIVLDPGIGFGKTLEQNLAAIRGIPAIKAEFGHAVLLGVSRKSFLGLLTDRPVTERLPGTLAAGFYGLLAGADILRVHDVAPHRDALRVLAALAQDSRPPFPLSATPRSRA